MWLETDKGNRIPAFHIRRGHPITILVSHANAEDLGIVLGFWTYMSDALQVDVFAYEYSGYGHSTGTPSEENMYSDARAALQEAEGFCALLRGERPVPDHPAMPIAELEALHASAASRSARARRAPSPAARACAA